MNKLLEKQLERVGVEAKTVPGFYDEYIISTAKIVYRVYPYSIHTAKGWEKRFRLKELLPRGKSQMVCLSANGRRAEVSIEALTRKVFPS